MGHWCISTNTWRACGKCNGGQRLGKVVVTRGGGPCKQRITTSCRTRTDSRRRHSRAFPFAISADTCTVALEEAVRAEAGPGFNVYALVELQVAKNSDKCRRWRRGEVHLDTETRRPRVFELGSVGVRAKETANGVTNRLQNRGIV
ncbi:hypothetical protein CFOL_v3_12510 [Cephalotus follicularis]|uniref:Uncharacterized protein n=1 Tax=Cephalotus follicularis TaxID=3775 RepID=A0A1Q3BM94_CEPFO|nr:hypothetical protein CFOL_v3_12510 [Cephalotus follicularis]